MYAVQKSIINFLCIFLYILSHQFCFVIIFNIKHLQNLHISKIFRTFAPNFSQPVDQLTENNLGYLPSPSPCYAP